MTTELRVVMFTDQVDSTTNMQDRTFLEVKRIALEQDKLTAEAVGLCRGKILKDTGDGHMIEFRSCSDAVCCGFIIQRYVRERNQAQSAGHLRFDLHIGIDFGEALVLPNGDLRAHTANLAARVSAQCPAGEVYFTQKVSQELHLSDAMIEKVGDFPLKGIGGTLAIFRLINWRGPIESTPNPFIWRDGITNGEDFFNRSNEMRRIRALLQGRQNCQVVGVRRIGKTSLLRQIERDAPEQFSNAMVAYLDLQDPHCFTLSGWLMFAGKQWHWPTPVKSLVDFAEGVEGMLLRGLRPVMCLDEFEEPTMRVGEFTRDFFLTLRSCGQKGLAIITASKRPLNELTDSDDPTSAYYNTFPLMTLDAFAEEDALDFINIHRLGVRTFNDEQREEVARFAKGHPLALQVGCYYALEAGQNRESLYAAMRKADIEMKAILPSGW